MSIPRRLAAVRRGAVSLNVTSTPAASPPTSWARRWTEKKIGKTGFQIAHLDASVTPSHPTSTVQGKDILRPELYHWLRRSSEINRKQTPATCNVADHGHEKHQAPLRPVDQWGTIPGRRSKNNAIRAFEAPAVPGVNDQFVIRRPGEVVDISTAVRNIWAFPLVGFNSILELPVYPFEVLDHHDPRELDVIEVPTSIFGLPLRTDILFRAYRYYVRAFTGWTERMTLNSWEWPGTRKKQRMNNRGYARMNWRRSPGRWHGLHAFPPFRPRDHSCKINNKFLHLALRTILSAKFAQDQIRVVEHVNLMSHRTKHCRTHIKRLLGPRCQRLLIVHSEGGDDVNDNFRWASANIPGIERASPETLTVYDLIRCNSVLFSRLALQKLIGHITSYPVRKRWQIKCATPDGKPAPRPQPVPGWDSEFLARKKMLRTMDFGEVMKQHDRQWKWSDDIKGPLKVARMDALKNFRLKEFSLEPAQQLPWERWEELSFDRFEEEGGISEFLHSPSS